MAARGGIDLGGTKIQAVVVDDEHNVLGQARRPTPRDGGPPGVAAEMVAVLQDAAREAGREPSSLDGVGIGSPGAVDEEQGTVAHARNLPDWEEPFPLAGALSQQLGTRIVIGNDVQVAVDAEFSLGAGTPYSSLLGVFWGTGVGGGIVLDGKPWLGRGAAGEIGHMVVKRNGARCPCGRRGCVEAYAGRAAMEALARRAALEGHETRLFELMEKLDRTRLTSGVWAKALAHEDPLATKLVDTAVEALGAGIASALNLLDVEAVIIGGGLGTRLGPRYAKRIARAMLPHLFVSERPPAVHVAALGDLGGAIGASLLVAA
jgi:glucokinase